MYKILLLITVCFKTYFLRFFSSACVGDIVLRATCFCGVCVCELCKCVFWVKVCVSVITTTMVFFVSLALDVKQLTK